MFVFWLIYVTMIYSHCSFVLLCWTAFPILENKGCCLEYVLHSLQSDVFTFYKQRDIYKYTHTYSYIQIYMDIHITYTYIQVSSR